MRLLIAVVFSFASSATLAAAAPAPDYRVAPSIAGTGDGGWDYAAVEPSGRHVFVAHSDTITEFDLDHATSRTIGHVSHAHAALPIRHGRSLLVTSGGDATVRIIDIASGKQTARIAVGANPDAAIIDPATGHVLVMNAEGGTISEIDPARGRVTRTITLQSGLEYAAIGRNRTLYVNNEDAGAIDTVDLASGRVGAAIAMPGCEAPSGLGYDAQSNRLIAACANGKAAIVDATAGRLTQLVDIGRGPDAVMIDPARRLAFVPCGRDGTLDILSLDAPVVTRIATVRTEIGARTGTIDQKNGTLYLPTARFGAPVAAGKRPPVQAGSFHLVVVRPS
jgi:YVTN family beta-propeller protein